METKERIAHAAFVVFLKNGYKSTTFDELVKAAEVSKGAFYYHFKNKEELFFEVIDRYFLSFFEKVRWSDDEIAIDELDERIRRYYRSFAQQVKTLTEKGLARYFILFFEAIELYPAFRDAARRFYTDMKNAIESSARGSRTDLNPIDLISKYEGHLFWLALFPGEAFDDLL